MAPKLKRFYLKTYGCQMNKADSQRISQAFIDREYKKTKDINRADLIIINSCIVRKSAENRVYGLINNLKKKNSKAKIILTGCLAGWALLDKSEKNLKDLQRRIGKNVEIILTEELTKTKILLPEHSRNVPALVPISNGCNHFCAYCIVPFARGKEVSRKEEEIIKEVKALVKKGFSEIMLLGQNVNSYGKDLKNTAFPQLLEKVAKIKGVKKVDFLSSNPWDFSDDLIEVIAKNKNIGRTLHLPVQSGDNNILKKMNRPYTTRQYLVLIRKIKKAIPPAIFSTDIIVGFPTETKKQFQNTVNLCKKVDFKLAYISKYSPRPGTAAAKLKDDVPSPEKKRRWLILENLINQKK